MKKIKEIEVYPTKHFYQTFRIFRPDRKCKTCGQIIKSKRPNVRFYFVKPVKSGQTILWKIRQTGKKTMYNYSPIFFIKK